MTAGLLSMGCEVVPDFHERHEFRKTSRACRDLRCRMAALARRKVIGSHMDVGMRTCDGPPPKRSHDCGRRRAIALRALSSSGRKAGGGTVGNR